MAKKEKIETAEVVAEVAAQPLPEAFNEDADNVNEDSQEEQNDAEEDNLPEKVNTPVASVAPARQKEVRFVPHSTFSCSIGGVTYSFRQEREHRVPADVACILINSKKGYRV